MVQSVDNKGIAANSRRKMMADTPAFSSDKNAVAGKM